MFFHPFISVFFFKEARILFYIGCAFFCKDYHYPVKEKREKRKLNECARHKAGNNLAFLRKESNKVRVDEQ